MLKLIEHNKNRHISSLRKLLEPYQHFHTPRKYPCCIHVWIYLDARSSLRTSRKLRQPGSTVVYSALVEDVIIDVIKKRLQWSFLYGVHRYKEQVIFLAQ